MARSKTPRAAIFNSRPDFIEALRGDLLAFVHLHQPELIVYDLPRPYESHWNFLRLLKETDSLLTPAGCLTGRAAPEDRAGI